MRHAAAVINAAYDLPYTAYLAFEHQAFSMLFSTAEKNEGVAAFLEKASLSERASSEAAPLCLRSHILEQTQ